MNHSFRSAAFLTALVMLFAVFSPAALAQESKSYALSDGISVVDAMTVLATCAVDEGLQPDYDSIHIDSSTGTATIQAGIFTFSVETVGGVATSATIACGYLDAAYARSMGVIFGRMVSVLGNFSNVDTILAAIDFNAFNTLAVNSQTLVNGDVKIVAKVDPDAANCYQLTVALLSSPASAPVRDVHDAARIMGSMGAAVSAFFSYNETNDLNGVLGKEGEYYSKVNFALSSISPNAQSVASLAVEDGGSIEVFASPLDAVNRQQKVASNLIRYFGTWEYDFIVGSALLRLSSQVSPEEAGALLVAFIHAVNGDPVAPEKTVPDASSSAVSAEEKALPDLNAGDTVRFGHYEQDNQTGNGQEPIEWRVLKCENGQAMLISVYALDVYNTYWGAPTWDRSTLRTWLNGTFLSGAFSADEQKALVKTTVKADKNPNYASDPGEDTEDYVFCLSYPEAASLLTASTRKAVPTQYARVKGRVYTESNGQCYWWLRSPGRPGCGAAIVCADGSFDYDESYDGFCYGVRPVVWVDLRLAADLIN